MNNSFRLKYSAIVWVLLGVVVALCLAGFVLNVYNFIYFLAGNVVEAITFALLVLATGALLFIVISVILLGRYTVKDGVLCMHLGAFKTKTDINDITEITHFKKSNKLIVYFSDSKYTVVLISPNDYERFVLAVREHNKKIVFSTRIDGEDSPA